MWIGMHGVVLGFTVCCCFFCVLERNVEMLVTNHLFEVKNPVFFCYQPLYSMCGEVRDMALKQPSVFF